MPEVIKGKRYEPAALYDGVRAGIDAALPGFKPYMALFGCSDEVNTSVDAERVRAFGMNNGVFTTRMIGSQVFFHQIMVAASTGHHSNVYEVNVHIGVDETAEAQAAYGCILGRDGKKRACCGALAHVLNDLLAKPDERPSISQYVEGEVYLDFLSTLKFRIIPRRQEIIDAEDRMVAITRVNLEVQIAELTRQLRKYLSASPETGPMFVFGTISYNRRKGGDLISLEHMAMVTR
ncbi:MAG: hypothetical protein C4576_18485 [Desulfobacteraceae bacterium]|nr:MAG: hypothetical protein C4576_18485 [Desulfobacteraceae bacterium]